MMYDVDNDILEKYHKCLVIGEHLKDKTTVHCEKCNVKKHKYECCYTVKEGKVKVLCGRCRCTNPDK